MGSGVQGRVAGREIPLPSGPNGLLMFLSAAPDDRSVSPTASLVDLPHSCTLPSFASPRSVPGDRSSVVTQERS